MYSYQTYEVIDILLKDSKWISNYSNAAFVARLSANLAEIKNLYGQLYSQHVDATNGFENLINIIIKAHNSRSELLIIKDETKSSKQSWITDNDIVGMSLYVDRFAGDLKGVHSKLDYFDELGVNFLHLMPIMESPVGESDGGYAVSDFRKVDKRFGTMKDLNALIEAMNDRGMYLMLDIVLNHTSYQHEWAIKASAGDAVYQDYYYMYDTRMLPDQFERSMPEVFPDSSPGNFIYDKASGKWVMTVFNHYQWDLNFTNPAVFVDMLDNIFYYANLGVDILRIDAPAFIWKSLGTNCQNLPEAHTLLQLIKLCGQAATPGMALLGEAIVAPKEIMKYFGTGQYYGQECDIAYNATQMALQWDALATGDTRVMIASQQDIMQKPAGPTWLTYTRCHDDIGLGYEDATIVAAGFDPYQHRTYLKNFYSGSLTNSPARGALFGVNEKTNDARISGSLSSLCGLESALASHDSVKVNVAIDKIFLMQAMSMFIGGIPMLYYGDEMGYPNDYSYIDDPAKSYDNRWMHRPVVSWDKNALRSKPDTIEQKIFVGTKRLIAIRKLYSLFTETKNIEWMPQRSHHIAAFVRGNYDTNMYCMFNFSKVEAYITWFIFRPYGINAGDSLVDVWSGETILVGRDDQYCRLKPYQFLVLKVE